MPEDANMVATPLASATTAGNKANHRALQGVRARTIGMMSVKKRLDDGTEPGKTQTMSEDPFAGLAAAEGVIEPPFDMLSLAMLPENSSELNQTLEAMVTNVDGFGHRQKSRVRVSESDQETANLPEGSAALRQQVIAERTFLVNFFEYATEESFTEFRKRLRKDIESTGNGYFEVIRDAKGLIQSFKHIPSYQMRLTRVGDEQIQIDRPILELQTDGSVVVKTIKEWRRFRRFVQSRVNHRRNMTIVGSKARWFKAFLDPRALDNETGKFLTPEEAAKLPTSRLASEVIHMKLYCARSPYGLPRYIGNLLSIYGDRSSEEINYTTFRNNNIPSMVVLCSNGQLTEGSIQRIESFVESQIQGSDNYSKFLIIEGESNNEEGEEGGQLKLEIKPLTQDQHDDALFQKYSQNNQDKIRRAFRLPPIFVGRADDYTRATAESSRRLADEQVFAPERDAFDALMNRDLYPAMGIRYHKFKSNSPNTTDNTQLVAILAGAEKTGGMTPRIARHVLEDILSQDIGDTFPDGFDPDLPFSLTMAEAVKNMADAAEPGQQVTALKTLKTLGVDSLPEINDPLIAHLMDVKKALEDDWERVAKDEQDAIRSEPPKK